MFVSASTFFFFFKDFSGTTLPRIFKVGTNIEYDLLYCVRESQLHAYHSLYLYIFLFLQQFFFSTDFSALMRAKVFKLCIYLQRVEVYCAQENHEARIYFAFFSISHSNVMHREI